MILALNDAMGSKVPVNFYDECHLWRLVAKNLLIQKPKLKRKDEASRHPLSLSVDNNVLYDYVKDAWGYDVSKLVNTIQLMDWTPGPAWELLRENHYLMRVCDIFWTFNHLEEARVAFTTTGVTGEAEKLEWFKRLKERRFNPDRDCFVGKIALTYNKQVAKITNQIIEEYQAQQLERPGLDSCVGEGV